MKKKRSIPGKRMTLRMDLLAKNLQRQANKVGRKLSYLDALDEIVKGFKRRR
jgi:hypothetical protein|tara:strand:- start:5940 stop:6095 length:156 start_codon:yes stop_codon:yes gene_type:complete